LRVNFTSAPYVPEVTAGFKFDIAGAGVSGHIGEEDDIRLGIPRMSFDSGSITQTPLADV